jgi:hypothetical protein
MNEQEVEDENDEDAASLLVPPPEEGFGIRRPLRETNWLYRSDSLRPNHVFEAVNFFGVAEHLLSLAHTFFVYSVNISTYKGYLRMALQPSLLLPEHWHSYRSRSHPGSLASPRCTTLTLCI